MTRQLIKMANKKHVTIIGPATVSTFAFNQVATLWIKLTQSLWGRAL